MKAAAVMIALCSFGISSCSTPVSQPDSASTSNASPTFEPTEQAPEPIASSDDEATEVFDRASATSVCASLVQGELEVCTAYVLNASLESRLTYYKLGRSTAVGYYKAVQERCTGKTAGTAAGCRLQSRYYGAALSQLQSQAELWPAEVDVSFPRISISSVAVDASGDIANIKTTETWNVKTRSGEILFAETGKIHTVALKRVQGLVLHKWVVTEIN